MASPQAPPAPAAAQGPPGPPHGEAAVDLHWLPLGAGGRFVRFHGRLYEGLCALRERRGPLALYHCALEVRLPQERFAIELTPIPDADGSARGVVCEGPVGSRRLARFRLFRYELRCWRDGVIPDLEHAVGPPQRLTDDPRLARRLLELLPSVPTRVWGRDELGAGEMWNSNSVIAWLITSSGVPDGLARPPAHGRAPGWDAGSLAARNHAGPGPRPAHTRAVARLAAAEYRRAISTEHEEPSGC